VAIADSAKTDEGKALSGKVRAGDADHLDELKVVAVDFDPNHLGATLAVNADGSYTYTPGKSLAAGKKGQDFFTYTVADLAGKEATAKVTIEVTGVNDAPEAIDDLGISTNEDTSLTIAVQELLKNDTDIDGDALAIVEAFSTSGATVSLNDGTIAYTPVADFAGTDHFTYRVSDGKGGFDTATVQVQVNESQAPNEIVGGPGDDLLQGTDGNDVIVGLEGNDSLEGGAGDDTLYGDGKDGVLGDSTQDSALYAGSRGQYHLTRSGNEILVTDLTNKSTDTLRDIEKVEFEFGGQANLVLDTDDEGVISGSETDDYLFAFANQGIDQRINAGPGIDVVVWSLGDGNDSVDGGADDDELQLNLSADLVDTVTWTQDLTDPAASTVAGGTGAHAFMLTLRNVEAVTAWYQDEQGNWIGENLELVLDETVSDPVSFTADEFSNADQQAFDSGALDTPVDFLI
jgi:VCBS repeat-containing protein